MYIIKSGEFEQVRLFEESAETALTGKALPQNFRFAVPSIILGLNCVAGYEDVFEKLEHRTHTVRCTSADAVVYFLPQLLVKDFVIGVRKRDELIVNTYTEKVKL